MPGPANGDQSAFSQASRFKPAHRFNAQRSERALHLEEFHAT
jgi:hypothetical protein